MSNFPFVAFIGQDEIKLGLILNIIDPKLGGFLIMGDRGSGKSTLIRSLKQILPHIYKYKDDFLGLDPFINNVLTFNSNILNLKTPFIELPLGASEDHICGKINLKALILKNHFLFEPGLLAKANRGILYIDEINLLDDYLVDLLLDVTASGINIIERDGISYKHPTNFILIGSGNLEEGEMRPQLLDRFGMYSKVSTIEDPLIRAQIVQRRLAFDDFSESFTKEFHLSTMKLYKQICRAKNLIFYVHINSDYLFKLSKICSELKLEGLRGDLVIIRSAKALAAFEGRLEVTIEDIERVIFLCLRHRLPYFFENLNLIDKKINVIFKYVFNK